jgi:hypothetical protein
MNIESVSIKTFLQRRRNIKGNGTVLCSLTAAGLWQVMLVPQNASDRGEEKKKKKDFLCVK